MTNLLRLLFRGGDEKRYSFQQFVDDKLFTFNGTPYAFAGGINLYGTTEEVEHSFRGYIEGAYKANGIIFSVSLARSLLFSEARFQWQRMENGRAGDLFGSPDLAILESPWPNGTTGELLTRMDQDASLAGNFYAIREGDRLRRLRPDWVEIILSNPPAEAIASDIVGYRYTPGGPLSKAPSRLYLPEETVHWSPIPDPDAQYRGMSWLSPIVREVMSDKAALTHKLKFFENAATLGPVVSVKEGITAAQFREFVEASEMAHRGVDNAYKTMYLGGGADVTMRTADMRQLDFRAVQGAGETRIAAAGRVPPIIAGLSEGLQAATYSNYGQARRAFGDHWARPQWRSACAALESVVRKPAARAAGTVRLWYDDRDIAFLREDQKDAAEIQQMRASTVRTLMDAGYTAESVKASVAADDFTLLVHSGLFSVQLQPPMTSTPDPASKPTADTKGDADSGDTEGS